MNELEMRTEILKRNKLKLRGNFS